MFYVSCNSCQHNDETLENSLEQYRQVLYDTSKTFEHFLVDIKTHYNVPAIAAVLVTLDSIKNKAVIGVKNYNHPQKVAIEDIFCIGSCAKSMTATLVATMVEQGTIDWNTRPFDIFPEFQRSIHPEFKDITIRQLLSHTAGIQQFVSDEDYFNIFENIQGLTGTIIEKRRKFAIWNLKQQPATPPGSYSYSNGDYVIVASMLEKITGESWELLIKKYVFEPLNLHSAYIGMPQDNNLNNVRRHYYRYSDGNPIPLPLDARPMASLFNPAGTISVSITDFANYALFHLKGLSGVDTILQSTSIEHLHKPVAEINNQQSYALGWNIINMEDTILSTHSGGDSSVYAVIVIDRRKKIAGVVMCNMGDSQAKAACANIMLEIMP
jgi:CubicO group peptidase (beta-lactamase class C family)